MTFAEVIEEVANGECILGIVISKSREYDYDYDPTPQPLVPWEAARPLLDYEWNSGFGGADCHAITAWTESRVIFVHEYDGSTNIVYVPRHPVNHRPKYSGLR